MDHKTLHLNSGVEGWIKIYRYTHYKQSLFQPEYNLEYEVLNKMLAKFSLKIFKNGYITY